LSSGSVDKLTRLIDRSEFEVPVPMEKLKAIMTDYNVIECVMKMRALQTELEGKLVGV